MEQQIDADINKECPGVTSDNAGHSEACQGCPGQSFCCKSPSSANDQFNEKVKRNINNIKEIFIVVSGKGGVGKSTIATLLAHHIANDVKNNVAILDIDICGPSIAKLTNTIGQTVHQSNSGWSPVLIRENLFAMSSAYLVDSIDTPIIWKGNKKNNLIKRFLADVDWSEIDYLIIDTPPGTSDEHISLLQILNDSIGKSKLQIIMVSLSDTNSVNDCRRQLEFIHKMDFEVRGIIENMKFFKCNSCGHSCKIFDEETVTIKQFAIANKIDFLGTLDYDNDLQIIDKDINTNFAQHVKIKSDCLPILNQILKKQV